MPWWRGRGKPEDDRNWRCQLTGKKSAIVIKNRTIRWHELVCRYRCLCFNLVIDDDDDNDKLISFTLPVFKRSLMRTPNLEHYILFGRSRCLLDCRDCGFESHRVGMDVCLLLSVVCCLVEGSSSSWSLVQRSPTKCDREAPQWGSHSSTGKQHPFGVT